MKRAGQWMVVLSFSCGLIGTNALAGRRAEMAIPVCGTVFCDANGNGRRDAGEGGIPAVEVSNGQEIIATDSNGRYALDVNPTQCHFVFITTPDGYQCGRNFYRKIASPPPSAIDFGLVGEPRASNARFTFAQITDVHVESRESGQTLAEDLAEIAAERERPAFILSTGDLVNFGKPTTYEQYRKGTKGFPGRFYDVIGNHDAPVEVYEEYLGPTWYSFNYGRAHFVVLNCLEPRRYARWLKTDLDRQPKNRVIIACQHFEPKKDLLDVLSHYNTRAFLNGHWHSNKAFYYGKILVLSTPPLRFGGIDGSSRGYRLITVDNGIIRSRSRREGIKGTGQDRVPTAGDRYALRWKTAPEEGTGVSAPLIDAGRVYLGIQDDDNVVGSGVWCLNSRNGKQIWTAKTDSSVNGRPAVENGIVCAVSVAGTVYGWDAGSGQPRWRFSLGHFWDRWIYNSPVLAGGRVFCGAASYFVCLDLATGRKIWRAPELGPDWISCRSTPAIDESAVYLQANWSNGLTALSRKDGSIIWNKKIGFYTTHSSPVIQGGTLVDLADGMIHSLEKANGNPRWEIKLEGGWTVSTPAIKEAILAVGCPSGKILAVQAVTGKVIWSYQTGPSRASFSPYTRDGSQVMASPVIANHRVYVGASDGSFYILDLATGKLLWKYRVNLPIVSAAFVAGNRCYVSDAGGTVYAFEEKPDSE